MPPPGRRVFNAVSPKARQIQQVLLLVGCSMCISTFGTYLAIIKYLTPSIFYYFIQFISLIFTSKCKGPKIRMFGICLLAGSAGVNIGSHLDYAIHKASGRNFCATLDPEYCNKFAAYIYLAAAGASAIIYISLALAAYIAPIEDSDAATLTWCVSIGFQIVPVIMLFAQFGFFNFRDLYIVLFVQVGLILLSFRVFLQIMELVKKPEIDILSTTIKVYLIFVNIIIRVMPYVVKYLGPIILKIMENQQSKNQKKKTKK
jgi:hypothetical protein